MLGKLIKYEFKSTGRILPLIYLAVLALSVCVGLSFRNSQFLDDTWGSMVVYAVYVLLVITLMVLTIAVILVRFYKSMISQEGYLMHTLPVKPWQHITGKLVMAVVWSGVAILIILASLMMIGGISGILPEAMAEMNVSLMINEMEYIFGKGFLVLAITAAVVQVIRLILQAYASMAIGGSSVKNKVAYSFLAFIVIMVIVTVVTSLVGMASMIRFLATNSEFAGMMAGNTVEVSALNGGYSSTFIGLFTTQLVIDGILAVIFFILTNHFLGKRLNLE